MDAFVKIVKQKKSTGYTLHKKEIDILKSHIKDGKNVMICGASGTGKSFIINSVLDETNSIEVADNFKVLEELKESNMHLILDDYRHEVLVQRQLIERVSEGDRLTKKPFIVSSNSVYLLPNFELILVPKRAPEQIATLDLNNNERSLAIAKKCKGNLHNFFDYMNCSDEKDHFIEPKELASLVLCDDSHTKISDLSSEHGHVWGVIHENYLDSNDVNYKNIAYSLSDADLFDTSIYQGHWSSMLYFENAVINIPRTNLGKKLNASTLRPGSFWTKFGNYKMRSQKYNNIKLRSGCKSHQELYLLRKYAIENNVEMYTHYKLTPQDFDVINHLSIGNKLKPREVSQIKKKIKEYTNEQ